MRREKLTFVRNELLKDITVMRYNGEYYLRDPKNPSVYELCHFDLLEAQKEDDIPPKPEAPKNRFLKEGAVIDKNGKQEPWWKLW